MILGVHLAVWWFDFLMFWLLLREEVVQQWQ